MSASGTEMNRLPPLKSTCCGKCFFAVCQREVLFMGEYL